MNDSTGKCELCGKTLSRRSMTTHLKSCIRATRPAKTGKLVPGFHLFIEARYLSDYWLHIFIPVNLRLSHLDAFLRDMWLECCGHLSEFRIAGIRYEADSDCVDAMWRDEGSHDMSARLKDVLEVGTAFEYDYDFGSTTELRLKVVAALETEARGIAIMAQNDAPKVICDLCGQRPAQVVCPDCDCRGEGWFCRGCAEGEEHECGDEMLLPVVNSPRVGVCAYTGRSA